MEDWEIMPPAGSVIPALLKVFIMKKETVFSELKAGDRFFYHGSNIIWKVIWITDNERIYRISSDKKEIKVDPSQYYKGKKNFNMQYGDRRVCLIN